MYLFVYMYKYMNMHRYLFSYQIFCVYTNMPVY